LSILKHAVKSIFNAAGLEVRKRPAKESALNPIEMPDNVREILGAIETSIDGTTIRGEILRKLRALGLGDFGRFLFSIPDLDFPKLSNLLPRMASKEIQTNWTGAYGLTLLAQTEDFVRSVSYNFFRLTGRTIESARILDFGCGYGRITRLMYYFADEDQIYAVDPWDKSIEICHSDGLTENFLLSDFLPTTLPVGNVRFDLIFAFSVFTHLSERATLACLKTLTDYIKPGGVIVITIRPVEYWAHNRHAASLGLIKEQESIHSSQGFSFLPHEPSSSLPHNLASAPVDRDIDYGDTSMTVAWIENSFPMLRVVGQDRSTTDQLQIYLFIQMRSS
jgi:SAM-dependent methyltransferase